MTNKEIIEILKQKNIDSNIINIISDSLLNTAKSNLLNKLHSYVIGFFIDETINSCTYNLLFKFNYNDWDKDQLPDVIIELENLYFDDPILDKMINPNYKLIWKTTIDQSFDKLPKQIVSYIEEFKNKVYSLIDEIKEFGELYYDDENYIFSLYDKEDLNVDENDGDINE